MLLRSYYGWFSAKVVSVLRTLGQVLLVAGGLVIVITLALAIASLLAKMSARRGEFVPRGRDRHAR